ncbi:MAG: rod shape-determining protein MreD [Methyloceanibacter sp.]|jgi:rod shape-determining protein MreD|uniref:rod shape-determining protein MreD n=1 Tax=Methyloceanibacter sp. TaxID=1965321 RepID=UPI003C5C7CF3
MTRLLPGFSVLMAVIATAVPWGLTADATFILPLLVVMMVFCWRAIPDTELHPAAAAVLGLLADLLSGGPLGFWALMCLIAATVGLKPGSFRERRDIWTEWLAWTALICALGLFGWLLASLYYLRWIDWWPIAFGVATSIIFFPVMLYGLLWVQSGRLGHSRRTIFRSAS